MYGDTWKKSLRAGQPIPRPPGTPTPCQKCPKADTLDPTRPWLKSPAPWKDLSNRNMAAWMHYLQIKATGLCPEDAQVIKNAGLIRMIEDQTRPADNGLMMLAAMMGAGKGRK